VLFDCLTFPDLSAVQGDVGGRAVLQSGRYPIQWLDWPDKRLLLDIDNEEDYRRLAGDSA
jgi:CTP:molybdopterin cytidylyltransferase MocA